MFIVYVLLVVQICNSYVVRDPNVGIVVHPPVVIQNDYELSIETESIGANIIDDQKKEVYTGDDELNGNRIRRQIRQDPPVRTTRTPLTPEPETDPPIQEPSTAADEDWDGRTDPKRGASWIGKVLGYTLLAVILCLLICCCMLYCSLQLAKNNDTPPDSVLVRDSSEVKGTRVNALFKGTFTGRRHSDPNLDTVPQVTRNGSLHDFGKVAGPPKPKPERDDEVSEGSSERVGQWMK